MSTGGKILEEGRWMEHGGLRVGVREEETKKIGGQILGDKGRGLGGGWGGGAGGGGGGGSGRRGDG